MIRHWTALLAVFLLTTASLSAATPTAFPPKTSEIVVPGAPSITMGTIENHLRLMEFVLGTRFTSDQKNRFFGLVSREGATMAAEDRREFLSADDLVATMSTMTEFQRGFVADMLRSDFEASAAEDPSDPAAQFFATLAGAIDRKIAGTGSATFTLQALEAFIEYLAVCRGLPGEASPLTDAERDGLLRSLAVDFERLSEPVRDILCGFDHRWHLLRTALTGGPADRVSTWKTALARPFTADAPAAAMASDTPRFDGKPLETLIQPDLCREMASAAIALGENPRGWTATPTVRAW